MKERSKENSRKCRCRAKLFDSGKEILLGTNKYPNKK
jgi:hypothetical protein